MKHVIYKGEEYVIDIKKLVVYFFIAFNLGALVMIASTVDAQTVVSNSIVDTYKGATKDEIFLQKSISFDDLKLAYPPETELISEKTDLEGLERYHDLRYGVICYFYKMEKLSCVKL